MYRIPLPPNNSVFDLTDEEMQKASANKKGTAGV
jgi:hypothetical protein